ncbi:DUF4382 domain-containing protein [Longimicrobium sp.]|uniref:DUF4382 domain-containing protein n=1 Tax=Longimicrobium sp. TaxID=2029185 RepID=UPI002B9CA8DE|nr:DUF4382 domain-containing protein [Longimicrobium sp.]HSU15861.1 DUF4382 domain-containing protein [Longimicrobium sp.]
MFKRSTILLPLAAALFAGACGDSTGGGGAPRLSIRLHDAPGDLKEAWVKVDRVYLQGSSPADSVSGRVDLLTTQTGWLNLTQLTGSNFATLVNNAQVPAGTYSQLRFVVCEAYVVTKTGEVFATSGAQLPGGTTATGTLQVPSGCQSGLKVKLPGGGVTLADSSAILSVDFDVSQSFGHQAGASGKWVMHPVLTATSVGFSGTISGTVAPAAGLALPTCGGSAVTAANLTPLAISPADSLSATVAAGGTYSIAAAPATYTMSYVPTYSFTNGDSLTVTAAPSVPTATVAAGTNTTVNYTISAATCKPHA